MHQCYLFSYKLMILGLHKTSYNVEYSLLHPTIDLPSPLVMRAFGFARGTVGSTLCQCHVAILWSCIVRTTVARLKIRKVSAEGFVLAQNIKKTSPCTVIELSVAAIASGSWG
jgi:hypothetical protein